MNALITSYGIDCKAFQVALNISRGIVAGSAALAGYLQQEGINPGFQPTDLDIFIPGRFEHLRDSRGRIVTGQYIIKSLKYMKEFLESYGFNENNKFGFQNQMYYSSLNAIQNVTSFTNKDGKEIQIIVVDSYNIVEHITKDFDLSMCVSWYDPRYDCFRTLDPNTTKRKEMYLNHSLKTGELHVKNKSRIEKYIARGFKLIDPPCPFINTRDTRNELSHTKFDGIDVMDIYTFDEIPLRDYLQTSSWNIVIKAGETYYAFERKSLMKYMKQKSMSIRKVGIICETPFNQCITQDAYYQLGCSDYSIYELAPGYSVSINGGGIKSLFHLKCYSIMDWINGEEGGLVCLPPKEIQVTRIIKRGEPLPPQTGVITVSMDDILAARAHLAVPGNLEAFHNTVRGI